MHKKLLKFIAFIILITTLPINAMKKLGRPIFSKSTISLMSPRSTIQSKLNLHSSAHTAKSSRVQRILSSIPQRVQSKSLAIRNESPKKQQQFNYNEFIGPLIAGVALGTAVASTLSNKQKVYAEEDDNKPNSSNLLDINKFDELNSLVNDLDKIAHYYELHNYYELHKRKFSIKKDILARFKPFITEHGEMLAQTMCEHAKTNDAIIGLMATLINDNQASDFTKTIAEYVEHTIRDFTADTNSSGTNKVNLITALLSSGSENRIKISMSLCTEFSNIEEIFNTDIISTIFIFYPQFQELTTYATVLLAQQFSSLSFKQSENFYNNFTLFLYKQSNNITQKFIDNLITQNLPIACNIFEFSVRLWSKLNPYWWHSSNKEQKKLAELIIAQGSLLKETTYGPVLLNNAITKYDSLKELWFNSLDQQDNNASIPSVMLLTKHKPCDLALKKRLEEEVKNQRAYENIIPTMVKIHAYNSTCPHECIKHQNENPTNATLVHLQKLSKQIAHKYSAALDKQLGYYTMSTLYTVKNFSKLLNLLNGFQNNHLIKKIIAKEDELKENYYTFIHGQRSEYLPCEELHTFLQQTTTGKPISDYLSLHVKEINRDQDQCKKQKKLRNNLLKNARTSFADRQHLLFANWAYFGNSTNPGSSSADYIASNNNVGMIRLTPKHVFKLNRLKTLYPKYKEKLKALHTEFKNMTKSGTCIMLAIPKKTINKHIYPAVPGGAKRKIAIKGVGETDDMSIIMEILLNDPEKIDDVDRIEFCIPMTYDKKGALNPESGIKVFAFTEADKDTLDDYYARQKALFEEIKKDIKQSKGTVNNGQMVSI